MAKSSFFLQKNRKKICGAPNAQAPQNFKDEI
jgi:hypothetical protein